MNRVYSFNPRCFQDETTEKIFLAVQEQQKRNYHNHSIKASKLVRDVRLQVLQDVFHAPHEKQNIVTDINLSQASTHHCLTNYRLSLPTDNGSNPTPTINV